ncbi:hypothetical protein KO317_02085 [Candidatus Micrarchaeota archaeon]|nr:hypothetical protein [Candidatus Micrarchaeota archaeon]
MDWIILTLILAIFCLGGITIFYMMARAFSLKGLEKWCKSEYMEILITAFIILAIIGFIQGMLYLTQEVSNELTHTTSTAPVLGSDPVNAAVFEVYKILGPIKKTYRNVFSAGFFFAFGKEISIIGTDMGGLLSKTFIPGAASLPNTIIGTFTWIINVLGIFVMWMYFFVEVMKFGDYLAVIILPMGIILRAFPPTRGVGAMFIAMGLGFAIVLPSAFLMTLFVSGSTSESLEAFEIENLDEYNKMLEELCIGNNIATASLIKNMAMSIDYQTILGMFFESSFFAILLRIFISPVIALIITYTFIRSFAMMLGADLAEIGRGLIKLI